MYFSQWGIFEGSVTAVMEFSLMTVICPEWLDQQNYRIYPQDVVSTKYFNILGKFAYGFSKSNIARKTHVNAFYFNNKPES